MKLVDFDNFEVRGCLNAACAENSHAEHRQSTLRPAATWRGQFHPASSAAYRLSKPRMEGKALKRGSYRSTWRERFFVLGGRARS